LSKGIGLLQSEMSCADCGRGHMRVLTLISLDQDISEADSYFYGIFFILGFTLLKFKTVTKINFCEAKTDRVEGIEVQKSEKV
jgi:hypothetical protein